MTMAKTCLSWLQRRPSLPCHDVAVDVRPVTPSVGRMSHAGIQKWVKDSESDSVVIDLRQATFIDTMGLTLVVAAAERAEIDEREVIFHAPVDPSVCNYAARMHLGECLAKVGVDARLPTVRERDLGNQLLELHRFDPTDSEELADHLRNAIADHSGSASDAGNFYAGVSEALENVVEHSGVHGGWAAMQTMAPTGVPEITFAVADVGRGLRASLGSRYEVEDDAEAIDLAFTEGVSGTGEHNRGEGLPDLHKRVRERGGILRVWTGLAAGTSQRYGPIKCRSADADYPGTIIYASFKAQKG